MQLSPFPKSISLLVGWQSMRRGWFLIACSSVIGIMAAASVTLAADAPQPGQWEVASKSERRGTVTTRPLRVYCMTPDKARDFVARMQRDLTTATGTCKSIDPRKTDTGMSWSIQCAPEMPLRATASYTFEGAGHYIATVKSEATFAGKTLRSTLTIEGRRIGECPK